MSRADMDLDLKTGGGVLSRSRPFLNIVRFPGDHMVTWPSNLVAMSLQHHHMVATAIMWWRPFLDIANHDTVITGHKMILTIV